MCAIVLCTNIDTLYCYYNYLDSTNSRKLNKKLGPGQIAMEVGGRSTNSTRRVGFHFQFDGPRKDGSVGIKADTSRTYSEGGSNPLKTPPPDWVIKDLGMSSRVCVTG